MRSLEQGLKEESGRSINGIHITFTLCRSLYIQECELGVRLSTLSWGLFVGLDPGQSTSPF
jgi:hypothetical protein